MNTSQSDIKSRLEFYNKISLIQIKLFSPGIESEFQNEQQLRKFKMFRLEWSKYVQIVQIDILSILVDKLK